MQLLSDALTLDGGLDWAGLVRLGRTRLGAATPVCPRGKVRFQGCICRTRAA